MIGCHISVCGRLTAVITSHKRLLLYSLSKTESQNNAKKQSQSQNDSKTESQNQSLELVYSWRLLRKAVDVIIDVQLAKLLIAGLILTYTTFAVRETASLGIRGAPRVPPLNPSESIVL